MGSYDTIFVAVDCPFCGTTCLDGQTKELDNAFLDYRVGDDLGTRATEISVLYDCHYCKGAYTANGEFFDVRMIIKNGKLTGKWEYEEDYSRLPSFNPSRRYPSRRV